MYEQSPSGFLFTLGMIKWIGILYLFGNLRLEQNTIKNVFESENITFLHLHHAKFI